MALLRLDFGRPDHLAPLLGFVGNELPEVYRRHRHRHSAKVGEPRLHLRISQALIVLLIKLINDLEDVLLGAPMLNQPLTSWPGKNSPMAGMPGSASERRVRYRETEDA